MKRFMQLFLAGLGIMALTLAGCSSAGSGDEDMMDDSEDAMEDVVEDDSAMEEADEMDADMEDAEAADMEDGEEAAE